jgi:hypothetical protein
MVSLVRQWLVAANGSRRPFNFVSSPFSVTLRIFHFPADMQNTFAKIIESHALREFTIIILQ